MFESSFFMPGSALPARSRCARIARLCVLALVATLAACDPSTDPDDPDVRMPAGETDPHEAAASADEQGGPAQPPSRGRRTTIVVTLENGICIARDGNGNRYAGSARDGNASFNGVQVIRNGRCQVGTYDVAR